MRIRVQKTFNLSHHQKRVLAKMSRTAGNDWDDPSDSVLIRRYIQDHLEFSYLFSGLECDQCLQEMDAEDCSVIGGKDYGLYCQDCVCSECGDLLEGRGQSCIECDEAGSPEIEDD